MRITLDTESIADYHKFLAIKQLPKYSLTGSTATFPDEYASMLGCESVAKKDGTYKPSRWLFDYQRDIAAPAIKNRKYSAFAAGGLGKTAILRDLANLAEGKKAA